MRLVWQVLSKLQAASTGHEEAGPVVLTSSSGGSPETLLLQPLHEGQTGLSRWLSSQVHSGHQRKRKRLLVNKINLWICLCSCQFPTCSCGYVVTSGCFFLLFSAETWTCLSSWSTRTPGRVATISSPCPTTTAGWAEGTVRLRHATVLLRFRVFTVQLSWTAAVLFHVSFSDSDELFTSFLGLFLWWKLKVLVFLLDFIFKSLVSWSQFVQLFGSALSKGNVVFFISFNRTEKKRKL